MDSTQEMATAQLISNVGNIYAQMGENRKQRQWNAEQAEKAYARSLEAWHMANEYNSPAAQMKRFRDAGLNPNLIYQNLSNSPAAQSSPSYRPPSYSGKVPSLESFMVLDWKMQKAQIEQIEASTERIIAETSLVGDRKALLGETLLGRKLDREFKYDQGFQQLKMEEQLKVLRKMDVEIEKIVADKRLKTAQAAESALRSAWAAEKKRVYDQFGTNIDKDDTIERKIVKVLPDIIKWWKEEGIPEWPWW